MSSQESASTPSPSLLSNLRKFRFQKKILEKLTSSEETPEESSQIGARRRVVRQIQESESEEEEEEEKAKEKKAKEEEDVLCSREEIVKKEKSLNKVIEAFPSTDKMVLQDALISANWDAQKAIDRITKENIIGQMKRKLSEIQDIVPVAEPEPRRRPSKVRRKDVEKFEEERDDDDDDEGTEHYNEKVFDSDDSDEELPDIVTGDKKKVLEFLSDATAAELRAMPNCSLKKAEAIIEQRPFSGWKDLVEKLQAGKFLGTELLNSAQEVLYMRQQMKMLLKKCKKMATRMEQAIASGGGSIKKQPSLIPDGLNLAPYQLVGLNWLVAMDRQGLSGILADEMGLGKTIQVIAFFAFLKEHNCMGKGPHLVIVPSSTLENWKNELDLWCPSLRVVRYYGSKEERKMMRVEWAKYGTDDMDVILTTYSMINTPEEKKMFRVLSMHYVVYDEAHMLKNMNSQRYDTFIRINASHRILLTGTPLQNNLLELISLLMFVMPKMFVGVKEHLKFLFAKVPKQGGSGNEKEEEKQPNFEKEQIERAKRIMKPFVLRRLKCNVLKDLPTKTLETVCVPLAQSQKKKYDKLIKTFAETSGLENAENHMTMMMMLRKMSNHPLLMRYHYQNEDLKELAGILVKDPTYKGDNEEYIFEDLQVMSDFEIYQLAKSKQLSKFYIPHSLVCESGKFIKFDEILPDLKRDSHRVIIFSQFVIMLDVMEEYLKIREHGYLRLDGSTPVPERQEMIDKFNNDPTIFVILLSTRAGGVGINLTAADTVIIHDIDFNPYNDKQAEDRCHRLGQSRSVSVLRFVSEGTIEEGIYRIAQEKLTLEKEINSDENEVADLKNVASLLKQALGLDSSKANHLQNQHA